MPNTIRAAALLSTACLIAATQLALADKLDDVKARGRLLVGTSDTSPPFSSKQNGKVVGYDVDLAARVAQRLALPMETISIVNADRIPALQQDRVDLVASGITRAENRKKDIGFSLAYLISPHKVLIRKDAGITTVGQMAGRKLALVKSASVDADLMKAVPTLPDRPLRGLRHLLQCAARQGGRRLPGRRGAARLLRPEGRRAGRLHLHPRL
jgi:polar amino acid transport system substrate-binding protein